MSNEAEVFTSCKDCCFEDDQDCKINKLPLLEANGATLLDEAGHTLISGRLCNFKRNEDWYQRYQDDYLNQLNNELNIKYGVLINSYSVSGLSNIIDYFMGQDMKPSNYYIVYNSDNFSRQIENIQKILNDTKTPWSIKVPSKDVEYEYEFIHEFIFNTEMKNPFLLYVKDTNIPDKDLINKINHTINNELKQVMAFIDFDYIFAPTQLIKMFGFESLYSNIVQNGHIDKICRV